MVGDRLPTGYRAELEEVLKAVEQNPWDPSTTETWIVMFADLCRSTEWNTAIGQDRAVKKALRHNRLVRALAQAKGRTGQFVKELGDGVIIRFPSNKAVDAVDTAIDIQYALRIWNQGCEPDEQIESKIGIASGPVHEYGDKDVLGLPAALAARIADVGRPGEILVSKSFYDQHSATVSILKQRCTESQFVSMRGVDPSQSEVRLLAWHAEGARLREFPKRQFTYFPTRGDLERAYKIPDILDLAHEASEILVVGRSLNHWAGEVGLLEDRAHKKSLRYRFLLLDPTADMSPLDEDEQDSLRSQIPDCLKSFSRLQRRVGGRMDDVLRVTDHVLLESLTFFQNDFGEDILIFDISLNDPDRKAALAIQDEPYDDHCLYREMRRRAERLFTNGRRYAEEDDIASRVSDLVNRNSHPDAFRNDGPRSYVGKTGELFDAIIQQRQTLLPPACVQFEVTDRCDSVCVKCQRWRNGNGSQAPESSTADATLMIRRIAMAGVRSLIFSGGEPLVREDLSELARAAKEAGLHVGLLTNGVRFESDDELCRELLGHTDWIRVSLDGSSDEVYGRERTHSGSSAFGKVVNGLSQLRTLRGNRQKPRLGICYTITQGNHDDVRPMLEYYASNPQLADALVFKFAHCPDGFGPKYVCTEEQVVSVLEELRNADIRLTRNTNVPFVLWMVDQGYTSPAGIASGKPVEAFYRSRMLEANQGNRCSLRCFAPYVFALVDARGDVYPCCHLFFDNQELHGVWEDRRKKYCMGNIRRSSFESVWNGSEFAGFRMQHCSIDPDECGECTRHFLDNEALSELFAYYSSLCSHSRQLYRRRVPQDFPPKPDVFF